MSRSVDLFVDHGDDPHQLLVMLGSSTHGPAVQDGPGRWLLHLGGQLLAHVYRHPYVDDRDLHLTRYPWVVSIRTTHQGSLVDHPATMALRMVADDLRAHRCRVLLVLDLQYRIDLGPDDDPVPPGGQAGPEEPAATGGPEEEGAEGEGSEGEEAAEAEAGEEVVDDEGGGRAPADLATSEQ